jgi:hypothetical protein
MYIQYHYDFQLLFAIAEFEPTIIDSIPSAPAEVDEPAGEDDEAADAIGDAEGDDQQVPD